MKKMCVLLFAIFAFTSMAHENTVRKSKKLKPGHSITNKQIQKFGAVAGLVFPAMLLKKEDYRKDLFKFDPSISGTFLASLIPSVVNLCTSPGNKWARWSGAAKWVIFLQACYFSEKNDPLFRLCCLIPEVASMCCTVDNGNTTEAANKFLQWFRKGSTEKEE